MVWLTEIPTRLGKKVTLEPFHLAKRKCAGLVRDALKAHKLSPRQEERQQTSPLCHDLGVRHLCGGDTWQWDKENVVFLFTLVIQKS